MLGKEEAEALAAFRNGDMDARSKLIVHNLRLVAHIIKKYYANQGDTDDLVSIGTIGLIKAVDTFDASKSTRLSNYAARCIENEVLMHFRNCKKSAQDVSINEPIDTDNDGNALSLMDVICCDDTIAEEIALKINCEALKAYIDKVLTPRERIIIALRYGLSGDDPHTQQWVADRLRISRSYVSRIEKAALAKIKKYVGA